MAEDELDNLLSNANDTTDVSTENAPMPVTSELNRPKLKKIKRPKIRPMPITDVATDNADVIQICHNCLLRVER